MTENREFAGGDADRTRRRIVVGGMAALASATAGSVFGSTQQPQKWPWAASNRERFRTRVVLITGATSGIGEASARAFAAEGARVFFCGRRADRGNAVAQSLHENGAEARFHQADVREERDVRGFVEACVETYGRIDIAFNNAGIEGPEGDLDEIPMDGEMGCRDVMRTNLDGVFFAMRYELPVMRRGRGGVVINTASSLAHEGADRWGAYSASKHGVIGLTRSAALANAGRNLRILSISPGAVDTALLRRMYGDLSLFARTNPSGRIGVPEDIAAVVLNLAAPEMSYLNGVDLRVNGGSSA